MIRAAEQVANHIKEFADGVQSQRKTTENDMATAVTEINDLLDKLEKNNEDLARARGFGQQAPGLLDRRDALLKELAEYLPIQHFDKPTGGAYIQTPSGIPLLVSDARHLSFQPSSAMSAQYS